MFIPNIRADADASPEGSGGAARAPGPAGAARERQMVVAEGEEGAGGAEEVAEQDVEGVVAEIGKARRDDVDTG